MSSISSWGRPSKVDWSNTLPWGSLSILHILTSLGRFDFWQGKWTPNWKIPVGLESIVNNISNVLSCTQFWHRKGLQNHRAKRHYALGCGAMHWVVAWCTWKKKTSLLFLPTHQICPVSLGPSKSMQSLHCSWTSICCWLWDWLWRFEYKNSNPIVLIKKCS